MEPKTESHQKETIYIIYDSQCSFCCFWTDFIKQRIQYRPIEYIARNSDTAEQLKQTYQIPNSAAESIILVRRSRFFIKSDAVFEISGYLRGYWKYIKYFKWIPRFIRNRVYDFIAFHRHSLMSSRSEKKHDQ